MASVLDVEVTRTRLEAAISELTYLLYRSAYSTLMRESRDCSIYLMSPEGHIVVNGLTHGHRMNYHHFIRVLLDRFPDMAPGDIYLSNHPYDAAIPHTPDLGVVVPAFCDGVLVGFGCSIAHKADFGGSVVGSASMGATHLFQEGLLLPPLRYRRGDVVNEVVDQVIASNVRNPDLFFGDMRAQLGVSKVAADRIIEIARLLGADTLFEVYRELLDQGERNLRQCLSSWPDGSVSVEGWMDNDGVDLSRPVRLALTVTVVGDEIIFDTTESDDQTVGPVNMTIPFVEAAIYYALAAVADPAFGFNDGMRRAVQLVSRKGSVLDPNPPAPVGAATSVNHRFVDLCFEALGHFVPERSIAHSGGSGGTLGFNWQLGPGARALQYEVLGSAMGAMADRDGISGVAVYATNLAITSVEILESQFPMRVRRFELICDSGGPGATRGGLSYRREYEAVNHAGVSRRAERGRFPGRGVSGGLPGSIATVTLISGGEERRLPIAGHYEVAPGEVFRVEGAGGGGMGDPLTRDPQLVALDVRRGYVSRAAAREHYGVALDDDLGLDDKETQRLRGRVMA